VSITGASRQQHRNEREAYHPLRQCPTEDTQAAVVFMPVGANGSFNRSAAAIELLQIDSITTTTQRATFIKNLHDEVRRKLSPSS
jgi:hypothetical protein